MTQHILCAVDLAYPEAEAQVLRRAAELACFYGAPLSVVTVIPDYGMSIVGSFFKEGTLKKAAEAVNQQLHDFVAKTILNSEDVQHIVEIGTVYEMVLDAIERSGADLVVMGAQKPGLVTHLQGSNSARVARHSGASVLIVRD